MPLPTNIPPVHLQRAEEATTRYLVRAIPGTLIDHVLDPDYWAHIAGRLLRSPNRGIHDEIRIVADDGTFDVEVTVVAVDPRGLWAQVRPLRVLRLETGERPASQWPDADGYTVEFAGPHKWRVLNTAGDVVAKELPDEAAALAELAKIKHAKRKSG